MNTSPHQAPYTNKKSFFDDIIISDSKHTTASDSNWGDQNTQAGSKAHLEILKLNQMLDQRKSMQEVMENEI